jgi:hypothetical protein
VNEKLFAIRRERAELLAAKLSEETGIPVECILDSRVRDPEVVPVRHRLWKMLHETGLSKASVATVCGHNHSTVYYALSGKKRSA